jgi:hypothetical protein
LAPKMRNITRHHDRPSKVAPTPAMTVYVAAS